MKHIPILFSTPMVQAILEGRKSMTRRVFNVPTRKGRPKYEPGDILWVRETWQTVDTFPEPDCFGKYLYKANRDICETWRPSIFMPKDACRIFLEVTDVRLERLHEIPGEDCAKEGVIGNILEFKDLWTKINGADSWEANPWVWVISFKRIDKPSNFQ